MIQRVIALVYHDVIVGSNPDESGFRGTNAAEYKISGEEFSAHLEAIKRALRIPVISACDLDVQQFSTPPVLLTFDDGGLSSYEHIAPILESYGWRGYFFITTDRIGTPSFVNRQQIKELHQRGHVIGSHSCSHPRKITDCTRRQLLDEWGRSLYILSEIIDEPVTIASVPGGFFSRQIAEAAAESGVRQLFTSEPLQKVEKIGNCAVIGRFSVKRGTGALAPAEIVSGNRIRCFRQYAYWNLKKVVKTLSGPIYPWIRKIYLARK